MDLNMLERRRDPRTQAYLPIAMHFEEADGETPGHLLDLSCGGAAVLTTAYNAPSIGQSIELKFDEPNGEGGSESRSRREIGVVVNRHSPERGVRRIGIRFLQHRGIHSGLFRPIDTLINHRKTLGGTTTGGRWETARHFDKVAPPGAQTVTTN